MVELLARAGAGEIVIIDFDRAELSNLNRVLHLRTHDVEGSELKAERLRQAVTEAGLPTKITVPTTNGDVRDPAVAQEISSCDLIIGCVDKEWPRLVMCELAYQYLIPLIDLGTEISGSDTEIHSLDARVSLVGPGRPCLLCTGVVSQDRLRLESYGNAERGRHIAMGYSADIQLKAPAVMDLNMRAASQAMLLVRHLLQPFLATPLAHPCRETVTSFHVRALRYQSHPDCTVCGSSRLGFADALALSTFVEPNQMESVVRSEP